jgi:hypothetical protein
MSTYIKLSNSAYPRHIGDIEIDPAGMSDYALVEWRDPPTFNEATELCHQTSPIQENGVWHMVWDVRGATQQEIDNANNLVPRFRWSETV